MLHLSTAQMTKKKINKQNEKEFKGKRGPSQLSSLPHFI
jgi:hypothetical protein